MSSQSTIKRIQSFWKDGNYHGSYTGASTFYNALKVDNKIPNLTYSQVLKALKKIPSYQMHVRRRKKYETRHLNFIPSNFETTFLSGVGITLFADLGEMPKSKGET
jgi:hypothetical protein